MPRLNTMLVYSNPEFAELLVDNIKSQKEIEAELIRKIDAHINEHEQREWKCKGFLGYKTKRA